MLPPDAAAIVEIGAWPVPAVFGLIAEEAAVGGDEMYRVFNMGIGLVLVVASGAAAVVLEAIPDARVVGRIVERTRAAVILARP